jgi:hypothetical protein
MRFPRISVGTSGNLETFFAPFLQRRRFMMMMGFAEILMLALLSGGTNSTDLVDLIQPKHYFESRQMEPSVDKMADLAGEEPKDAKGQIVQLTSLRYLADEIEALKKSPRYAEHRKSLEAIAQGKKAQDSLGFAKDYATRVLLKLDDKKPEAVKIRPLREDALSWFPANATLAGAIELRQSRQAGGADDPFKELLKMMPDREKKEMYNVIEKAGNIRVDRAAFAWVEGTGKRDGKIFVRISGKGDQDWMVAAFNMIEGGRGRSQIKVTKDEKDTRVTLIQPGNGPPVLMLVGNNDFLVVGYEDRNGQQDDLVTEVLEARSKKKANAAGGTLKDRLAKIPDSAVGLIVGEIPNEMKREFRVFDPAPTNILGFIERAQQGLDVQVETGMANEGDAGKLVQKVGALRKEGIAALKQEMQRPQPPGTPPIPFQSLINLMETLQVQSKTDKVQVRVFVPDGLIRQMSSGWFFLAEARAVDLPPPPAVKVKD